VRATSFALGLAACLLAGAALAPAGSAQEGRPAGRSVWDGVYTEEQARRGETLYQRACGSCHGGDLAGDGFSPALGGPAFLGNWNGTTLADLFERVRVSMPPEDPESVSRAQKADILAFILKASHFPAGKVELASQTERLRDVRFVATKP
jgi:mono/diheme cytochrome c family protein